MLVVSAILAIVLVLAAVFSAVVGPISAVVIVRRRWRSGDRRGISGTPIVGSVLGFVAILVAPLGSIGARLAWSWVPLAVEVSVLGLCWGYWIASGSASAP